MESVNFPQSVVVQVDYSMSLKEMLYATGIEAMMGYVNAVHFPLEKHAGIDEFKIKFREYNTAMSGEAILQEMQKSKKTPVKIGQFIALCMVLIKLDEPIKVACLGTIWHHEGGIRAVVSFINDGSRSQFVIRWVNEYWDSDYRFPYIEA
jgi:hypothetical protein